MGGDAEVHGGGGGQYVKGSTWMSGERRRDSEEEFSPCSGSRLVDGAEERLRAVASSQGEHTGEERRVSTPHCSLPGK